MKKLILLIFIILPFFAFAEGEIDLEQRVEQLEEENARLRELVEEKTVYVTRYSAYPVQIVRLNRQLINPYFLVSIDTGQEIDIEATIGLEFIHRILFDITLDDDFDISFRLGWMF
jgi:hypothetical protein